MACIHLTEQHAGPNGEQLCKQIVGGECVPDSAPEGSVDMTLLFQHFGQVAFLWKKPDHSPFLAVRKDKMASFPTATPFFFRPGMAEVGKTHRLNSSPKAEHVLPLPLGKKTK